jgi:hypothetical protein
MYRSGRSRTNQQDTEASSMVHFTKENGEFSSVTPDEQSKIEIL